MYSSFIGEVGICGFWSVCGVGEGCGVSGWGVCVLGVGWVCARCGVGSGSPWNRFGVGLGSVWDRSGIGLGSVWGRSGVGLGSASDGAGDLLWLDRGWCGVRMGECGGMSRTDTRAFCWSSVYSLLLVSTIQTRTRSACRLQIRLY